MPTTGAARFDLIGQLYRGEFETGCVAKPLDLDPDTAGDQLDCTMTPVIDDVEQRPIPYCGSSLPCWELYEVPYCTRQHRALRASRPRLR